MSLQNPVTPPGIDPWTIRLVAQRLNHYTTPDPIIITINIIILYNPYDKWVPLTNARRVLRLRTEERPAMWRVAAIILNKQLRTADKGWSFSLVVGRGAKNSSP